MNEVKVSVIVPVYKIEEPLLRRCLDSLSSQTLEAVEILLVDDGCPQGGGDICEEYAGQGGIRVIHQANRGVSAARNTGLKEARGKYVSFVDGDDFVSADYCRVLYETAEREGADIVSCAVLRCLPDGQLPEDPDAGYAVYRHPEEIRKMTLSLLRTVAMDRQDLRVPENHYSCAHLFLRSMLGELRFQEGLFGGEDKLFNFRVLQNCHVFCRLRGKLYAYVMRSSSATGSFRENGVQEALALYELYRSLPVVCENLEYRNAWCIRTCCMALTMSHSHFFHPNNPSAGARKDAITFFRHPLVAEAVRGADVRAMRPCKMKVAILLLKAGAVGTAVSLACRWRL